MEDTLEEEEAEEVDTRPVEVEDIREEELLQLLPLLHTEEAVDTPEVEPLLLRPLMEAEEAAVVEDTEEEEELRHPLRLVPRPLLPLRLPLIPRPLPPVASTVVIDSVPLSSYAVVCRSPRERSLHDSDSNNAPSLSNDSSREHSLSRDSNSAPSPNSDSDPNTRSRTSLPDLR